MTSDITPTSKVLVHDESPECEQKIKEYCESHKLVALKPNESGVLEVLKSYVDLGAIFLSADLHGQKGAGIKMGKAIHNIRPELPIFLRVTPGVDYDNIALIKDKTFCKVYEMDRIEAIQQAIDEHIFCAHYPNALIRGIEEITRNSLLHFFADAEIEVSAPYLVKDRIIFGELFSLIPIESGWCKGYMMLQSQEQNVREMVSEEKMPDTMDIDPDNFRVINDILSEITNMAWGAIRNRFISKEQPDADTTAEVPIIVNHQHKYITFGTNTPQLCFRYTLTKEDKTSFTLFIKFVFNLYWKPENFSEDQPSVNDLLQSGELEFF